MTESAEHQPPDGHRDDATARERLAAAWQANEDLRKRLDRARLAYDRLAEKLDDRNRAIAEARSVITKLREQLADMAPKRRLEQSLAARDRLAERLEDRNRIFAEARDVIAGLQEDLAAERYARVRERAEAEGVASYILTPRRDGTRPAVPGYAVDPYFLPSRRDFVEDLVSRDWVRPTDRVLDVGCGIGAVAAYLVPVVGDRGSYVGVDVIGEAIAECRRHFGTRHPNFSFEAIDVQSDMYNPDGSIAAREFAFPFADDEFDLAILRSLFTHMLPEDVERYVAELGRIVKPGGRTAITYFLLDDVAQQHIAGGTLEGFDLEFDGYRIRSLEVKEAAVAIDEARVKAAYERNGFEIVHLVRGGWRLPERPEPIQDLVLARRA